MMASRPACMAGAGRTNAVSRYRGRGALPLLTDVARDFWRAVRDEDGRRGADGEPCSPETAGTFSLASGSVYHGRADTGSSRRFESGFAMASPVMLRHSQQRDTDHQSEEMPHGAEEGLERGVLDPGS